MLSAHSFEISFTHSFGGSAAEGATGTMCILCNGSDSVVNRV